MLKDHWCLASQMPTGSLDFDDESVGVKDLSLEDSLDAHPTQSKERNFFPVGFAASVEFPIPHRQTGMVFLEKQFADMTNFHNFLYVVALIVASHHASLLDGQLGAIGAPGAPG